MDQEVGHPQIVQVPGTPKPVPSLGNIRGFRVVYYLDDEQSDEEFDF